jgi:hypothetical protein
MQMRRFTRLTNAFSKKVENHMYAVALHSAFYNWCRPHQTPTKARGGMPMTPAIAAGLAARVWAVEDLLMLMAPSVISGHRDVFRELLMGLEDPPRLVAPGIHPAGRAARWSR